MPWPLVIAGMFLAMGYFGCDQSQVQRYLSGRSLTESRLSLLFNAFLKVPMQFLILLTGVLVFVFFFDPGFVRSTSSLRSGLDRSALPGFGSARCSAPHAHVVPSQARPSCADTRTTATASIAVTAYAGVERAVVVVVDPGDDRVASEA